MTGLIQEMRRVVAEVVGDDKTAKDVVYALISNFGGERLTVPANDFEKRNQEIKEMRQSGATVAQLARHYQLSPKTIYRILG